MFHKVECNIFGPSGALHSWSLIIGPVRVSLAVLFIWEPGCFCGIKINFFFFLLNLQKAKTASPHTFFSPLILALLNHQSLRPPAEQSAILLPTLASSALWKGSARRAVTHVLWKIRRILNLGIPNTSWSTLFIAWLRHTAHEWKGRPVKVSECCCATYLIDLSFCTRQDYQ